jgi:hypothetical protein
VSNRIFWLLAAALVSSTVAAESYRHRAQPEQARTWVIDANGLFLEEARKPRRAISLPQWQWAHEPYACAPDIAIGPRGEVIVTSNVLPVLWKVEPETLAVSVHRLQLDVDQDKDVGFSGLVYSPRDGAYLAVSELHGSMWRIDPLLLRAQKIALSEPVRGACSVSMQRQERASRFTRLCLDGKNVNLAPDQRFAYVQAAGCPAGAFALEEGAQ